MNMLEVEVAGDRSIIVSVATWIRADLRKQPCTSIRRCYQYPLDQYNFRRIRVIAIYHSPLARKKSLRIFRLRFCLSWIFLHVFQFHARKRTAMACLLHDVSLGCWIFREGEKKNEHAILVDRGWSRYRGSSEVDFCVFSIFTVPGSSLTSETRHTLKSRWDVSWNGSNERESILSEGDRPLYI